MSIDDNEIHHARAILDEIFGERRLHRTTSSGKEDYSPKSRPPLLCHHDFILLYAKNADNWQRNLLSRTEEQDKRYKNPDNDPEASGNLVPRRTKLHSEGTYPIVTPSGRVIPGPPKGSYWRVSQDKQKNLMRRAESGGETVATTFPAIKRFLSKCVKELFRRTFGLIPK